LDVRIALTTAEEAREITARANVSVYARAAELWYLSGLQMDPIQRLTSAVPDSSIIFHYTSQNGLLGIIKSKSLWASSIRHLL